MEPRGTPIKKKNMEFDKVAFGKSAIVSTFATALFGVLGLPILFELILVATLTKLFRKQVLDNAEFQLFVKENILDRIKEKNGRNIRLGKGEGRKPIQSILKNRNEESILFS